MDSSTDWYNQYRGLSTQLDYNLSEERDLDFYFLG